MQLVAPALVRGSTVGFAPLAPKMTEDASKRGSENPLENLARSLDGQTPLLDWLYAKSQGGRWAVPRGRFVAALERSAKKALPLGAVTPQKLQDYLDALHLAYLALATACAEGGEAAWEHFFTKYRAYLRAAAAPILRCKGGSAEACDLADSLFSAFFVLAARKA